MPTRVRAVLLDFDGTLVDSEPLHFDCWMQAVRPFGAGMDWVQYTRRLTGATDRQAAQILLSEAGHEPTEELIQQVWESKRAAFNQRFCDELTIDSAIHNWIARTSILLPIGIVSSSLRSEVEPLLVRAGLRPCLQVLVCGDDVTRHKPHPEPYLTALQRLTQNGRSFKPRDCLVVEDSASGIASAQAAGMRVRKVRSPNELLTTLRREIQLPG